MARDRDNRERESEYKERLLRISRVSKTVKGGRRISFSVLAAVGDEKGKVGIGLEKLTVYLMQSKKPLQMLRKI